MAKSLEECPLCHRPVEKLFLLDLEQFSQGYSGGTLLVCEGCLKNPELGKLLSDLSYDALTLEDEDTADEMEED